MFLQIDMAFPTNGVRLSSAVAREAERAAELLLRLSPAPNGPANITAYRQAFLSRYGAERELPLLELVHPEWGIGPLAAHSTNVTQDFVQWPHRAETLRNLAFDAIRDRRPEVELDDELLGALKTTDLTAASAPQSLDLNLFVLASSTEAIDRGDFQVMIGPNVGAASAGQNLGRFGHFLGPTACAYLERVARIDEERNPGSIVAEIVYLPRALRNANVVGRCILQEALPGLDHAWLPSKGDGHRIVELVVSLQRRDEGGTVGVPTPNMEERAPVAVPLDVRLRPPGSDWLFLKLYGPRSREDALLAGPIRRFCREIVDLGLATQWFFVRYADPDAHLRMRFHGSPLRLTEKLLPRVCAWAAKLIAEGQCFAFAFDTYEREVERYGGHKGATEAEALFAADSVAVLELISCTKGLDRVTLAVVTADDFLSALGFDRKLKSARLREIAPSRKEVSEEYRSKKASLISALRDPSWLSTDVGALLASRREALTPIIERLSDLQAARELAEPWPRLCESYLHMHCNRILTDHQAERRVMCLLARSREALLSSPPARDG